MKRVNPIPELRGKPCSIVGIWTAYKEGNKIKTSKEDFILELQELESSLKDGYCTLKKCNTVLRKYFDIEKYTYCKRAERKTLIELADIAETLNIHRALICVENHFIYADFDKDKYWSFYDNLSDDVIAIWRLK